MKKWIILICVFASISFAQSYFPLEVGNQWVFEGGYLFEDGKDTNVVSVLGDTLMPNGVNYFELSSSIDQGGLDFKFVRCDTIGIYFYDKHDSADELVYNLDAVKDEWYYIGYYAGESDSPRVMLEFEDLTYRFGYDSYEFVYWLDHLVPFTLAFSEKFGPVGSYVAHHEPYSESLIGCVISGVEYGTVLGVNKDQPIPFEFALSQNYPNPFNPTTSIEYQVSSIGNVTLKVYDVLGREITTIVNEVKHPGTHEVTFDASELPSGVYFYRLTNGNYSATKKMLLIK